MKKLSLLGIAVAAGVGVSQAQGAVVINEVLGSTTSTDTEFIELYNTGPTDVDLTGWTIELWESDFLIPGLVPGTQDGGSPYALDISANGTIIPAGGYALLANAEAQTAFNVVADITLQNNAIENSSYTMLLKDDLGNIINSVFVRDDDPDDQANDGTNIIVPDLTVGPDGSFLPAGFTRDTPGGATVSILEFSPKPAPSATPTPGLIPEPASLALLGLGGLAMLRRR